MNPRLTDDAVADLPLRAARAELLEEIMSTPAVQPGSDPGPRRQQRRWLVPVAVAAAVASLVIVPTWFFAGRQTAHEAQPAQQAAPAAHEWLVLTAPGWKVTYVSRYGVEREVAYASGKAELTVHLRDADTRDSYVDDRQHIDAPKTAPGEEVVLAGQGALLWAYNGRDHTTIGTVDGDVFPEVRGSGMDRAAFEALLGQLSWVEQAAFEDSLPESFVTTGESGPRIAEMLADIELAPGAETPTSGESDPYQFGADVAGQVACGWIAEYERATDAGDQAAAKKAQAALSDTTEWPFLVEMADEGDYPEVVWEYAADVGEGTVPAGYKQGLGCH